MMKIMKKKLDEKPLIKKVMSLVENYTHDFFYLS
jgi:hypothetical protein